MSNMAADEHSSIEVVSTGQPETKPAKSEVVQVKLPKRLIWSLVITGLVLAVGLVIWFGGWYQKAVDYYNTTSVSLRIKEDDKFALEGATVVLDGTSYTSDVTGKVSVPKIVAGTYTVVVSKSGYASSEGSWEIVRGTNDLKTISISKETVKLYSLKGVVTNYVSGGPVVDTQVSLAGQTVKTNPAGEFSFDKLVPQDYSLTLSKSGFLDQKATSTLAAESGQFSYALVPQGQVVFVSNRTGKRSIYVTNYDGSEERQLVTPKGELEDYAPVFSPDGNWIAFNSTRDGVKNNYGTVLSRLYLVDKTGKQLHALNNNLNPQSVVWSPDSKYLFFASYTDSAQTNYVYQVYDIAKQAVIELGNMDGNFIFTKTSQSIIFSSKVAETNDCTLTLLNLVNGERRELVRKTVYYFNSLSLNADDSVLTYELFQNDAKQRYELTVSNSSEQQVALPTVQNQTYYPSPDQKLKLFVEERDGKRDLYLLDAAGKQTRLTTSGIVHPVLAPRWDQTNSYVVVPFRKEGEQAYYIVSVNGGEPKKIVDYYDDQAGGYIY